MRKRNGPHWVRLFLMTGLGALIFSAPTAAQDPTYRVRLDMAAPLNADQGWAADPGEPAIVVADQPFRLRIETTQIQKQAPLALQARRNNGEWKTLEAHDFPYPERELTLSFVDAVPGTTPPGWTVLAGDRDRLSIVQEGAQRFLRAEGGEHGLMAVYPTPWGPSPHITIAARLRLGNETDAADVLFGLTDGAHFHAVRFQADGTILIRRVIEGVETILARTNAPIKPGTWSEVEIAAEEGRLQIEVNGSAVYTDDLSLISGEPGLTLAPGSTADFTEIEFEGIARAPQVSIVSAQGYEHADPTTDLLAGAAGPFSSGMGVSLQERAEQNSTADGHTEIEWPLVIRRYADGPEVSEDGDTFEFRMVTPGNGDMPIGASARVALSVPPGHLGGTFVETPGRIGPWQASNGDLYFIMEPSETDNKFMMMKSVDGGRTWREADGANRPETDDLEAVDSRLVDNRIHIIHQVTGSVRYHRFRISDHPTHPDRWEIRDEIAAEATAIAQMATLTPRSDGSIVTVFLADRLHYAVRGMDGIWSEALELDPGLAQINAGPQAVLGRHDTVHLAYFSDDGQLWYRTLSANGTLSERLRLAKGAGTSRAEYGAVLPLAYDNATDRVTVAYRLADGSPWERSIHAGRLVTTPISIASLPVVTNAVDSQQAGADLIAVEGQLFALFIDEATRSLFSTRKQGDIWSKPELRVGGIDAAWVRAGVLRTSDGHVALGYIYDAGSKGGTGLNRFGQINLLTER